MTMTSTVDNLRSFLKKFGHGRLELEFRLGMCLNSGFRPGIPERAWNQIREVLEASAAFEKSYKETREIIFDDHKHVLPDNQIVFKKRIAVIDDACDPFVVRACLSLEETEADASAAAKKNSKKTKKFERYKRRWSYVFECWTIDLTRVRSNAPEDLDSDIFEVEIELLDKNELFVRPIDNLVEYGYTITRDLCAFATI